MHTRVKRRRMERRIVEGLLTGRSANWLSEHLQVCKKRIKRIREQAQRYGYLDGGVPLPPYPQALFPDVVDGRTVKVSAPDILLTPHIDWIKERLEVGWHPITVFEEMPVKISRSSFYRFLNRHALHDLGRHIRNVIPEIVHQPGEALLLDWGKLCTVTENGRKRTLWAFAAVLGFSRYRMVRLVWSNDVETTLAALQSMLEELGGVPIKTTSDNPKCFALQACRFDPLLNPAYERFAAHYGTVIECLPPADPEKKGKVERLIPYIRRLYEAHGEWRGIEESQEYLNHKLRIANDRKHGTTNQRPAQVFAELEKSALKPLPPLAYQLEEFHIGPVRRDGHVRFRGKYYSLDEVYAGKEVTVLGNKEQVSIFYEGTLVEVHDRVTDPHRSKSTKPQHLRPWKRAMQDDSLLRFRARKLGPAVEEMVRAIIGRGLGFIDYRKVWGILSLDKKYTAEQIDKACAAALSINRISYLAVRQLLEHVPVKEPPAEEPKTGPAKFLHPIEEYKRHICLTLMKGGQYDAGNAETAAPGAPDAHSCRGA